MVYFINFEVFPSLFYATSMLVVQIFSRIGAAIAPQIAELPDPIPVLFLIGTSGIALLSSFFIQVPEDKEQ